LTEKDAVAEKLYAWLGEGVELRHGPDASGNFLTVPHFTEPPAAFVQQLLAARQRADRVEQLLTDAKRVRWALAAKQQEAADTAEEAFDRSVMAGSTNLGEFTAAIERKASAALQSFEEKRAARQAQRRLDVASEVVEALKDIHFGLAGWRTDMREVVRAYQLESNLER
jgi:hypothetical protein